jgi:hypothetical protein
MKRKRFSEEQIIGILKESEAGQENRKIWTELKNSAEVVLIPKNLTPMQKLRRLWKGHIKDNARKTPEAYLAVKGTSRYQPQAEVQVGPFCLPPVQLGKRNSLEWLNV